MAKERTVFVCQACGASHARWLGKCPACSGWDTLVEELVVKSGSGRATAESKRGGARVPVRVDSLQVHDGRRTQTGFPELDRVLGGGTVEGSVILLAGDPGIGKSTLLMQVLAGLSAAGGSTLYVSGEESEEQVGLRARRILGAAPADLFLFSVTDLERIEAAVGEMSPRVLVIDSIQTMRSGDLESAAGSVAQLREVTTRLVDLAKSRGMTLFVIGHVTKEGSIAGPKVLEHLVDVVLSFEGDNGLSYRVVRATKNRFGPANEFAVFEMVQEGLREVADPSALFLRERPKKAAGSVVVATAEGARGLLIEVQALVAPAVYGAARRVASGLDANRLAILLAVLDRKTGVHVLDRDVFASIAGGVRVEERALDLGVVIAVVSSLREKAIGRETAVFGEVGLAGEVRAVPRAEARISEARKLGFSRIVLPVAAKERLDKGAGKEVELVGVHTVDEALHAAFD